MLKHWHQALVAGLAFVLLDLSTATREEFAASPDDLVIGDEILRLLQEPVTKLKQPPPSRHKHSGQHS